MTRIRIAAPPARRVGAWIALLISWLLLFAPSTPAADTAPAPLTPFRAHYHLAIDGWPDAGVTHTLARDGDGWRATLHASIKIATGYEYSRFRVKDNGQVAPWSFYSRYRLFGFGEDYRMDADDMEETPDRESLLVQWSRQVFTRHCRRADDPCSVDYLDQKQDRHTLDYRIVDDRTFDVPGGHFKTRHVEAWQDGKPEQRLHFYFSPRFPGLLVQVDVFKHDRRIAQLQLTSLTTGKALEQDR